MKALNPKLPLVFLLFCLFGLMFPLTKMALPTAPVLFLLGVRMLLGGVSLLIFDQIRSFGKAKESVPNQWLWSIVFGLFAFFLANFCEYWGLQYLTSSKACLIYSLTPFITALFCRALYGETLGKQKMLGMLIGVCAFIPTFVGQESAETLIEHFSVFSLAELSLIGATTFAVIGWLIMKHYLAKTNSSLNILNGQSMFVVGILTLVISHQLEGWELSRLPVKDWQSFSILTIAMVLVSNFAAYNLYGHLLKHFSATFLSFAGFTTPFFAAIWGLFLLDERIGLSFIFSVCTLGVGLFIFNKETNSQA